jgi:hypothetical protein
MESYKDWLNTRISIWQEHAAINEQDKQYKELGISKAYVNAYHNALVEYEKRENGKAGLVGVSK